MRGFGRTPGLARRQDGLSHRGPARGAPTPALPIHASVLGRRAALLLSPLLVACAAGVAAPSPTDQAPPTSVPVATTGPVARQTPTLLATTAAPGARQPPTLLATTAAPSGPGATPSGATPPPAADAATVAGSIVLVQDDAVVVERGGQRRTVFAPTGGSVRDPVFSPDGGTIAFAHAPPPDAAASKAAEEPQFVSDLRAVAADGANPRVLVAHDAPGAVLETPAWAPDGKTLYFTRYAPEYLSAATTTDLVEVRRRDLSTGVTITLAKAASSPGPSPDGAWLAYVGETRRGPSLHRIAVDGTGDAELVPSGRFLSIVAPRVSPDGATIAFGAEVEPAPAATPPASGAPGSPRALAEPTATLIQGVAWEIWTVPSGGGPARQLTRLNEDTPRAAWSADGASLLVRGAGGMHLVDARTGAAQRVSAEGDPGGVDWRPTA
jgi:Tol biopolymer transport system component